MNLLARGCLLMSLSMIFLVSAISAQTRIIGGKVIDQNNIALKGVSVTIKGSNKGTTTNDVGQYSITVNNNNDVLVFSFVGYNTYEANVGNNTAVNAILSTSEQNLAGVVVVGYGSQRKKTLTTAVSTIKNIKDLPITSPGQALAGQAAGVNVQTTNGSPGQPPVIRIRGIGSIQAGNGPLYVVDGYPLEGANAFNLINPQDIDNISILKDAAAIAIYGSRGGNGVVIVTTKRGQNGPAKIAFSSYVGVQQRAKKVALLNTAQYLDFLRDYYTNTGATVPSVVANPPANLPDTDWQDEIYHNALQHSYQISASGGSDAVKYSLSGGYLSQEGIVDLTKYTRFNLRLSLDAQLSKKIKVGGTLSPSYTINDNKSTQGVINGGTPEGGGGFAAGGVVNTGLAMPPLYPVRYANGDYAQPQVDPLFNPTSVPGTISPNLTNPIASLNLYEDRDKTPLFLGSIYGEYQIIKDLKFKSTFGFQSSNTARNIYTPATLGRPGFLSASLSNPNLAAIGSQRIVTLNYNWVTENYLSYDKTFGENHAFSAIAGYSAQQDVVTQDVLTGQAGTSLNDQLHYVTNSGQILATTTYNENTLASVYGRVNYGYMSKYLFSATLRRDGSSRFGNTVKYANFPSVSAAWRVSEEKFMKNVEAISELKLRASYGVSGNNNIGNYTWQSYQGSANYVFGAGNGTRNFGYIPGSVTNFDLTWESNYQTDLGLELGLFNDRIYFTADYYSRLTKDLLFAKNLPALVGFATSVIENVGQVENKGLELAVVTKNLTGRLKWSTNANITFNKNKVLQLANNNFIGLSPAGLANSIRLAPGQALGSFYGYHQIGVYQNQADIANSPVWQAGTVKPGDIKYEDVNGDNKVDAQDITYLGSPLPKFTYGLINTFEYGRFDLNIIIRGAQGNLIMNANDRLPMYFNGAVNSRTNVLDRWKSEQNPGNGMEPRAGSIAQNNFSNRFLHDASFLQISNVTLGYTIPESAFKSTIKGLRVYGAIQNLATFSKYVGYNPEANNLNEGGSTQLAVDQGSYPIARTFIFGLNVNF
jgi:TonB-linked SusC/RagA family outer membrane protein